ncbi:maleylacetate reductase [Arthrobacter sp. H5]|uniref:maleylacetate reductase n=1 Tax=Arthrobacter sp. H5 TaxID=1267973 RepID=UPI000487BD48|nr:maleylacetate reductase [Arthrobacter sp. H5]
MSLNFEHTTLGQRVLFGAGKAGAFLAAEVARLGARRAMVISSASEALRLKDVTAQIDVTLHYDDVAPHVPVERAEKARAAAVAHGIDLLVCAGGGSATGLAKAVALTLRLPIIAIPTTYAGSEATNMWGLTEASRKTTGIDNAVLPVAVVYDAELSVGLPMELSIASGLNALAHGVDSMWGPRADPINAALAAEGIRALNRALPAIKTNPEDLAGREQALYGAYLAAVAFASAGSGMHHKICHTLGGAYNLPHAQTHAAVLPHVLAFKGPFAPEAEARIAAAFNSTSAVEGLSSLRETLEAPPALKDYGFAETDIPDAVDLILPTIPDTNPRTVNGEDLERLLRAIHSGATTGSNPE